MTQRVVQLRDIWFWQRILSPHMVGLARALAKAGCNVTYIAERDLSEERKKQGWVMPSSEGIDIVYARDSQAVEASVRAASLDSIHLCQGIRGNGLVSHAQRDLAKRGLQQWTIMETLDDDGWRGVLKRATYTALLWKYQRRISGVLAIGDRASAWVVSRGFPENRVFPFTYFLQSHSSIRQEVPESDRLFRFVFVGQFIERKRLPVLVDAMAALNDQSVELVVIGSGPLESSWRSYAEQRLPGRVRWLGRTPSPEVLSLLGEMDCLVLPSRHDGWGAVVSEALMSGTPAICSDHCGSAMAVNASGVGGVFRRDDTNDLANILSTVVAIGRLPLLERQNLATWASSLGDSAGAEYLLDILKHMEGEGDRPLPPWDRGLS